MIYFLYAIFFASCVVLIASVLLQPGKTDAGALFTSNVSSAAYGPRGTQTILSKITITAATLFMLTALFIAMPALQGNVSVLSSNPEAPGHTTTQPVATDASNVNSTVPANTAVPANATEVTVPPANATAPVVTNKPANAPAVNKPAAKPANANK